MMLGWIKACNCLDDVELGFITIFSGVLSFFFTPFGNFWCKYASTTLIATSTISGISTNYSFYFGIWNFRNSSFVVEVEQDITYEYEYLSCSGYGDEITMDTKWNSAKAFTIISSIIGGAAVFLSCAAVNEGYGKWLWPIVALSFLLACFSQGLTFLFFRSKACSMIPPSGYFEEDDLMSLAWSNYCHLGPAAIFGIVATFLWGTSAIVAGLVVMKQRASASEQPKEAEPAGKAEEESEHAPMESEAC